MSHISERVRFGTRENPANVPTPSDNAGWWRAVDPATPRQLEWFYALAGRLHAKPESLALMFGDGYTSPAHLSSFAMSWGITNLQVASVELGVCHDVDTV